MDPLPFLNKVSSLVIQEEINNVAISQLPSTNDINVLINASDSRKIFWQW